MKGNRESHPKVGYALMRMLFGVALIGLLLSLWHLNQARQPSLDRLADRVDRLAVIPDATRQEIIRLIETARQKEPDDRNTAAAARIERAMQMKPTQPSPVR